MCHLWHKFCITRSPYSKHMSLEIFLADSTICAQEIRLKRGSANIVSLLLFTRPYLLPPFYFSLRVLTFCILMHSSVVFLAFSLLCCTSPFFKSTKNYTLVFKTTIEIYASPQLEICLAGTLRLMTNYTTYFVNMG